MSVCYNDDARFREQVGLLIRALRSDQDSVQEIAVVQISLFGSKATPYLTQALSAAFAESDNRSAYRSNPERAITGIVKAFGIIGELSVVPEIIRALPRSEAVEALAKIGGKKALDAVIDSMGEWYAKYVHEKEYYERKELEPINDFVTRIFGYFGEEGTKALENDLRNGKKETKEAAARTLEVIGGPNSVPALVEALKSGEPSTKASAAKALHKLKAREALPQLISELVKAEKREVLDPLTEAVLDLGSLDDWITVLFYPSRPHSRGWSGGGIDEVRFKTAIINSGENAVSKLAKRLQDPDSSIQMEAAEMIAKIKRGEKEYQIVRY